jgi:hypothetical protein
MLKTGKVLLDRFTLTEAPEDVATVVDVENVEDMENVEQVEVDAIQAYNI